MRRIENFIKYVILALFMFVILLAADFFIIMVISYKTDSMSILPSVPREKIISLAENRASGDELEVLKGRWIFAMAIDKNGDVVWEHNLPDELPRHYTIAQAASFTRWYLQGYPVYTYTADDGGIVVVGYEKDTIWKKEIIYDMSTFEAYVYLFPLIFISNIFVLLVVPSIIIRRDARRRERERTTWIAGVSHDIRTPLSIVLGYADAIKQESGDAEITQKAQVIENQALRLKMLVTNLNTQNKLTYGIGNWKKERCLLAALIRETVCGIANCMTDEGFEFAIDIPDSLEKLCIYCDVELTKRLIENLVNNAVRHNPQGCTVTVSLAPKRLLALRYYEMTVSDNGIGIEWEKLKALRAHAKPQKLSEHGLGIRLVKQIASFHHWGVRMGNNEGSGFYCRIFIIACSRRVFGIFPL